VCVVRRSFVNVPTMPIVVTSSRFKTITDDSRSPHRNSFILLVAMVVENQVRLAKVKRSTLVVLTPPESR
jgi:hypothetical protein